MSSSNQMCQLPGCTNPIEEIPGRPVRRYCCPDHRTEARKVRIGNRIGKARAESVRPLVSADFVPTDFVPTDFVPTDFVSAGNASEVTGPIRSPYQQPKPNGAASPITDPAPRPAPEPGRVQFLQQTVDSVTGQVLRAADGHRVTRQPATRTSIASKYRSVGSVRSERRSSANAASEGRGKNYRSGSRRFPSTRHSGSFVHRPGERDGRA